MSMHNNFCYIIMCMFGDILCTIQVSNVAFYSEDKFEIIIIYIHRLNFTHALFNLLIS